MTLGILIIASCLVVGFVAGYGVRDLISRRRRSWARKWAKASGSAVESPPLIHDESAAAGDLKSEAIIQTGHAL